MRIQKAVELGLDGRVVRLAGGLRGWPADASASGSWLALLKKKFELRLRWPTNFHAPANPVGFAVWRSDWPFAAIEASARIGLAQVARVAIIMLVLAMGLRTMESVDDIVNIRFGLTLVRWR